MGRRRLPEGEKKKTPSITVNLRTQQADYLEYLAERDGVPISKAFWVILERHEGVIQLPPRKPSRKTRMHFTIDDRHLAILDCLAVRFGLQRADISRRLIDEALSADHMVGGT